jgi:hypothetical protein
VPRPIEPNPIITIAPSIVAWTGQSRINRSPFQSARLALNLPQEQKPRRLVNRRHPARLSVA